jgi:glycosyltransferase involved in cell wall biosynthesis
MRIGFDAKRATHNWRGLGNYSRSLIGGIHEYYPQEELFIYSPSFKSTRARDWAQSLKESHPETLHFREPKGVISKKLSSVWRGYGIQKDIEKDEIDIFHGLSHELPSFLSKKKTFWVVTIHDLIFLKFPEFYPAMDRFVYKQKVISACKKADIVIAICEQTKNDLIELLNVDPRKIVIHYQSCSPQFYTQKTEAEINKVVIDKYKISQKFILNVGAFEERKNQLNLVEAFALNAEHLPHDLVLIGQGKAYLEQVKQTIEKYKLQKRVHILNRVDYEELPAFYQKASVFCFPSFYEGFGIPIIEALFSKTPVITSLGSCFPESAGPHSLYIDPYDKKSIAQALENVLDAPIIAQQMREKGLQYAQRFLLKNSIDHLMQIYKAFQA